MEKIPYTVYLASTFDEGFHLKLPSSFPQLKTLFLQTITSQPAGLVGWLAGKSSAYIEPQYIGEGMEKRGGGDRGEENAGECIEKSSASH